MSSEPVDVSKRLDEVQEAVLGCLTIVADVMDILSASESATEQQLRSKCINYLQNIKISQDHVRAIAENAHATINFEPTVYSQMLSASIANEKSQVLDSLLAKAEGALSTLGAVQQPADEQPAMEDDEQPAAADEQPADAVQEDANQ